MYYVIVILRRWLIRWSSINFLHKSLSSWLKMLISYPSSLYCYLKPGVRGTGRVPHPNPWDGKNMTSHIINTSNALNRKSAAVYIIPTLHLRVLRLHPTYHLRDLYMCLHIYITSTNPKNHAIFQFFYAWIFSFKICRKKTDFILVVYKK